MGLFDFLKLTGNKDERRAECPYCHKALNKIPAKKTKCLHCGEFMFVRTRPKDNVRIVTTKNGADKIDEDWAIASGTHDFFIAEKESFKTEQEVLRKRFGKEPSDSDVKWAMSNKDLIIHAKYSDWGLYRNTRFQMAEILRKEKKLESALQTYLEVCFIDLNGPNNIGMMSDLGLLEKIPPFEPKQSTFIAPDIINSIKRIMKKLFLDNNQVKTIFITHNSKIKKSLILPISVEDAWQSIDREI